MGFMERLKNGLANSMRGRTGSDELSLALIVIGVILTIIAAVADVAALSYISLVFLVVALFRCYSKNITQRAKERDAFLHIIEKPKSWFSLTNKRFADRKTTDYFKCSGCGTNLSVPKGKGTIRVTCPKCKEQSTRKS